MDGIFFLKVLTLCLILDSNPKFWWKEIVFGKYFFQGVNKVMVYL